MTLVGDQSIHLVVTSPPYWQLKDYGHTDQIGFNDSYEKYINNLNLVWMECFRVLHPGCRLVVNIGDQFARSVYYGRYKIIPIRTEIIKFCETIGFDYMGAIIWQKVTTTNTTGGATIMGSFPYPRNGILKLDYEFILIFKKLGEAPKPTQEAKELSKLTISEWNEYFDGHWNFAGEKQSRHLAMFPEELPKRIIRMFTFIGDTVLDPFLGSGTTSLAAKNLFRHSIGYEVSADFLHLIEKKLGVDTNNLFEDNVSYEIIKQHQPKTDYRIALQALPYVFHDPIKFDQKIDPRKLTFGSRITGREREKTRYYSVKRVLTPTSLELDTGLFVDLLGLVEKSERREEAVEFLRTMLRGEKVYLRFETHLHSDEKHVRAYVYLRNRTFVNVHLLKGHLVGVDPSFDFSLKKKFLSLERE